MTNISLTEIVKGAGKGLAGTVGCTLLFGTPGAVGMYESIQTREGRIAYNTVMAGSIVALFTGAVLLSTYHPKQ